MKKEESLIEEVYHKIKETGKIDENIKHSLLKVFGKRFENALKALEEGAVKKYVFEPSGRVVWIVVGKERDYQIIPSVNYCSCDDFYFRVLDGGTCVCYHVLAQKLAEALNRYELITESDSFYDLLMKEWRFIREETVE
ncbi:hypothetical protein DRO26_04460 [Candidatus Bathyarchaeota archaeon]|nr:MAG: hypothetical protein DRO26_04460 [Candidatus Bathyarchaeota archaeon]